jgi:hypothetical protein
VNIIKGSGEVVRIGDLLGKSNKYNNRVYSEFH